MENANKLELYIFGMSVVSVQIRFEVIALFTLYVYIYKYIVTSKIHCFWKNILCSLPGTFVEEYIPSSTSLVISGPQVPTNCGINLLRHFFFFFLWLIESVGGNH